eukprot:CAMPEP_0172368536 /NCGR_PEP_ID=MMETSP1060-20121228/27830_1 /TAXON_ID=37318 /ORGANISM="Pseudo-nitzschia pungens, Strain cf. cingulata" /LENGTH=100 /DNA_ID=CAMNT_0013093165 /DNA_START=44 /DNA_END=346 /DNA_ORIENTATION=+
MVNSSDIKSSISRSESELSEYASRLDEECAQLLVDIRRVGVAGEPHTTFGELFDDEEVTNYYEALVGTLKAAKKRKMIIFQGQLLLKGVSDNVKISIVEG